MKFYNPTGYEFELYADRKEYKVMPFSYFEVHHPSHINLFAGIGGGDSRAKREHGIVPLNYDLLAQKKFNSYQAYKAKLVKDALIKLKRQFHEYYVNEQQAKIDITQNKGGEADKAIIKVDKFIEKEKEIDDLIMAIDNKTHPMFNEFKVDKKSVNLSDLSPEDLESLKSQLRHNLASERTIQRRKPGPKKRSFEEKAKVSLNEQITASGISSPEVG